MCISENPDQRYLKIEAQCEQNNDPRESQTPPFIIKLEGQTQIDQVLSQFNYDYDYMLTYLRIISHTNEILTMALLNPNNTQ